MGKTEAQELLLESLRENDANLRLKSKSKELTTSLAGVIGVGAGGGNVAHLLTGRGYDTAAFNTTKSDMIGLDVDVKIILPNIDGSGRDREFSKNEFKKSYKNFFAHDKIQKLLENDIIFVVGTGGGGTGTIISIMTAGYLKNEYPNKTIFIIGLLGSIKEDQISQKNMQEFMYDLENRSSGCPYLLFDNNKVKSIGDDVYSIVNNEVVDAIKLLSKSYFVENTRSNIDSRDYARLTSFGGLTSVIQLDKLNISVVDDTVDINSKVSDAILKSTNIVTSDPESYAFFLNIQAENYSLIDLTFNDIQEKIGRPTAGLVFKQLQDYSGDGPEMCIIMTGMASPVDRFDMIRKRIAEYSNVKNKSKLPDIERTSSALDLVGDSTKSNTGVGDSFLGDF